MQGDEEADDSGEEERGAKDIQLPEALSPGKRPVRVFTSLRDGREEEDNDRKRDAADREVDVEAPAPCGLCGKCAAFTRMIGRLADETFINEKVCEQR